MNKNNKYNIWQYLFGFMVILLLIGVLSIFGKDTNKKESPAEDVKEQTNVEDVKSEVPKIEIIETGNIEPDPIYNRMFTTCALNIRKEPSIKSEIYTTVDVNTELQVKQGFDKNGWEAILYNEEILYVNGNFLAPHKVEVKKPVQPKPVVNQNVEVITPEGGKLIGTFKITHYAGDTITSTGAVPTVGRTIAVDPRVIPYGSKVVINGHTYIAEDCGGAIKGNVIDIFVSSVSEAYQKGVYYTEVYWG